MLFPLYGAAVLGPILIGGAFIVRHQTQKKIKEFNINVPSNEEQTTHTFRLADGSIINVNAAPDAHIRIRPKQKPKIQINPRIQTTVSRSIQYHHQRLPTYYLSTRMDATRDYGYD